MLFADFWVVTNLIGQKAASAERTLHAEVTLVLEKSLTIYRIKRARVWESVPHDDYKQTRKLKAAFQKDMLKAYELDEFEFTLAHTHNCLDFM